MTHDPRYLAGVHHFNKREFYDAHEVWEALWRERSGEEHAFLKGLIQLATALHHFRARNFRGARILFDTGSALLAPLPSPFWGLPLDVFLRGMRACMRDLLPVDPDRLPGRDHPDRERFPVRLDEALIPVIRLAGGPAPTEEASHG